MNAQSKVEASPLATAMAEAFKEIEGATKSANNPHFKSKYADLGAVIDAVKPALINHGLFFTQRCQPSSDGVTVETVLHHTSGEEMSLGSLYVPANKRDAQGFGSALTYARRYGLLTAFGVPTEDDDGNGAVKSLKADTALIDDGQWATITQLIQAKGADAGKFCKYLGVASLKEIPASRYQEAVNALNAKPDPVQPKREPEMAK